VFIIPRGDGLVGPLQGVRVPVILLGVPDGQIANPLQPFISKLSVELLEVDEHYSDKSSKSTWASRPQDIVRTFIEAEVVCGNNGIPVDQSELTASANSLDLVDVSPDSLLFKGSRVVPIRYASSVLNSCFDEDWEDPITDSIVIQNNSSDSLVYRLKVSVKQHVFVRNGEGTVAPQAATTIPVTLRIPPSDQFDEETPAIKFALDLLPLTEDYDSLGSKLFWLGRGQFALRKYISSSFQHRSKPRGGGPFPSISTAWDVSRSSFEAFSAAEFESMEPEAAINDRTDGGVIVEGPLAVAVPPPQDSGEPLRADSAAHDEDSRSSPPAEPAPASQAPPAELNTAQDDREAEDHIADMQEPIAGERREEGGHTDDGGEGGGGTARVLSAEPASAGQPVAADDAGAPSPGAAADAELEQGVTTVQLASSAVDVEPPALYFTGNCR
jgi:hypothetical protein